MSALFDEILRQKEASFDASSQKRLVYDRAEELFHGQLNDAISLEGDSSVFDPRLSTFVIERGYRVMAQLPTGKVKGISSNDIGDAKLKNLLLEKYVIPNANAQFDFLTKLRMVDIYSNVYGSFDVLIDQDIKPNGYQGPDMWLLNKRDVFDLVGAVSPEDADSQIIRTWRDLSYFEGLKKEDGFVNIPEILAKLKDKTGSKQNRDSENNSKRNEDQYPQDDPLKGQGQFEVLSRFERDRWVDIVVDADMEFRDQANPHDNGELPTVRKYSIPLLDDPAGMGDMERGGSMQMAINANWNLYFEGVRMTNQPPVLINKDNVASISSFKPIPGALWLGRGQLNNIAQPVNLSPQGINSFNNTHNVANAALQNLLGTSNTDVPQSTDSTLGKTPQALKMQSQRENTRDNADRFYMEQFLGKVMTKMCNLMNKKQTGAVSFRMFPDEIEKIARDYPEIKNSYNDRTGKLKVPKGREKSLYDYEIVPGSTYAIDQQKQQEFLVNLFQIWKESQTPTGNLLEQQLQKDGYNFKFGELFKRIVSMGGIQDWDKILEEMTEQEKGEHALNATAQQFQGVLQQMQQGQPNMNAVPPMPGGQPGPQMPPQEQMPQGGQPPMGPPMGGM